MDSLSIIKQPIIKDLDDFKVMFEASLKSNTNPLLLQVSSHVLEKRGKMMRPILILLMAHLHGQIQDASLYSAVSLELLHTASLIHDDVVDESPERRGHKSVNAIYDNKVAVLTGDYLLATSLYYASKTKNMQILDIVSQLGRDLADGELLQLNNISLNTFSEEDYFNVIQKKTAALFAACAITGSLSVSSSEEQAELSRQIGEYMGICFQIRDDIFDYYSDNSIGKPTHNDMFEGKLTLPSIYVLKHSSEPWVNEVALKIKKGVATADDIDRFSTFVRQSGGIEYAVSKMNEYLDKGLDLLRSFPDSPYKSSLISYFHYIVTRDL
jgi:octaprenyl-diphosphate synthase